MVRVTLVAVLASMLTGCAGTVNFMVRESDKDPTFSFDGTYTGRIDHRGGRQEMGSGWFSDCPAEKSAATFKVVASEIFVRMDDDLVIKSFVDSKGRFRLEHLLKSEMKGIGEMLSDGSVTVIIQGNISDDTMKGLFVYGVAQFNNRGCSYPVSYTKN